MSPVNENANAPGHSTGPKTEAGKAAASRNAFKNGIFGRLNYVAPGEENEYNETRRSLLRKYNPDGPLETAHVGELLGGVWRLRRCGLVEAGIEDIASGLQHSVDRARANAQNAIRRATTELRRLQTETGVREATGVESETGMADTAQILKTAAFHDRATDERQQAEAAAEAEAQAEEAELARQKDILRRTIELCKTTTVSSLRERLAKEDSDTSFCNSAPLIPTQSESKPSGLSSNNSFCNSTPEPKNRPESHPAIHNKEVKPAA